MRGYLIVAGIAAGVTFLLTYVARWAAPRLGVVSHPGPRSVHDRPLPALGGAAMFVGFLVAIFAASRIDQFRDMFEGSPEPLGLILAAGIMFLVGTVDDVRDVSPPAKVAGMVLAGSVLSLLGVTMLFFRVPFASTEYVVLSPDLAPLFTVAAVVLMANAINLIDGLDGLAAGIVVIAGTALFLYADRLFKAGLLEGSNMGPLVAVIAVGVCVGFLPHNLHPARIIMGDGGALLLGLLMASTTITVGGRTADQFSGQTYFFFAPLLIPVVILGVPILDTLFAVVRRVYRRRAFHVADKDHLHHRLMRLGHGPRRAVTILWLWTALLSGLVLFPTYTNRGNALVPLGIAALGLALLGWFMPGLRSSRDAVVEGVGVAVKDEPPEVVNLDAHRQAVASAAAAGSAPPDGNGGRRAARRGRRAAR